MQIYISLWVFYFLVIGRTKWRHCSFLSIGTEINKLKTVLISYPLSINTISPNSLKDSKSPVFYFLLRLALFYFIPCCPYPYAQPLCHCFDKGFFLKCQRASPSQSNASFSHFLESLQEASILFGSSIKKWKQTEWLVLRWFVSVSPCRWVQSGLGIFSWRSDCRFNQYIWTMQSTTGIYVSNRSQVHDQSIKGIRCQDLGSLFGDNIAYYYCKKMFCHGSYLMQ